MRDAREDPHSALVREGVAAHTLRSDASLLVHRR